MVSTQRQHGIRTACDQITGCSTLTLVTRLTLLCSFPFWAPGRRDRSGHWHSPSCGRKHMVCTRRWHDHPTPGSGARQSPGSRVALSRPRQPGPKPGRKPVLKPRPPQDRLQERDRERERERQRQRRGRRRRRRRGRRRRRARGTRRRRRRSGISLSQDKASHNKKKHLSIVSRPPPRSIRCQLSPTRGSLSTFVVACTRARLFRCKGGQALTLKV